MEGAVVKEDGVHYNQSRDYRVLGVAGTCPGHGMNGRIIMLPASNFFRLASAATYAALLLFCAATCPAAADPSPEGLAESQPVNTEGLAQEPPASSPSQLPEPLQPGEMIFEALRKKALETGKESLLEQYIRESPGDRFAERARKAVDDIRFHKCRRENTVKGYTSFMANYPDSRHAAEAARRADDLVFAAVSRENSIEGFTRFIEDYPGHPLVPVARAAIEDLIFDEVKKTGSIIAWAEFLREHAGSERAAEAQALKDELEYEPYKKKDTEEGYYDFLRGFPVNRQRGEASSRAMALRAVRVKRETEAICGEAKMEGSYSCDFLAFEEGNLRVKILRISGGEQGQQLLMGGPGYAEEALRRYSVWKNETIKRLLRILGVISVTVE